MGTPTTARVQARSAVPLPSGEALVRARFCLFIRCDNRIFIRLANFTVRLPDAKPPRWGGGPRSEPANGRWWGFPYGRSFTSS